MVHQIARQVVWTTCFRAPRRPSADPASGALAAGRRRGVGDVAGGTGVSPENADGPLPQYPPAAVPDASTNARSEPRRRRGLTPLLCVVGHPALGEGDARFETNRRSTILLGTPSSPRTLRVSPSGSTRCAIRRTVSSGEPCGNAPAFLSARASHDRATRCANHFARSLRRRNGARRPAAGRAGPPARGPRAVPGSACGVRARAGRVDEGGAGPVRRRRTRAGGARRERDARPRDRARPRPTPRRSGRRRRG